jgi:hypothetical protein
MATVVELRRGKKEQQVPVFGISGLGNLILQPLSCVSKSKMRTTSVPLVECDLGFSR